MHSVGPADHWWEQDVETMGGQIKTCPIEKTVSCAINFGWSIAHTWLRSFQGPDRSMAESESVTPVAKQWEQSSEVRRRAMKFQLAPWNFFGVA